MELLVLKVWIFKGEVLSETDICRKSADQVTG